MSSLYTQYIRSQRKATCFFQVVELSPDGKVITKFDITNAPCFEDDEYFIPNLDGLNTITNVRLGRYNDIAAQEYLVKGTDRTTYPWTLKVVSVSHIF